MVTSRCGVRCDLCKRKDQVHCKGCIQMIQPFWGGVCEVKTCVEHQHLDHCGQCSRFPCVTLCNMGKEHGFDPQIKIKQCKLWREEEKQSLAKNS